MEDVEDVEDMVEPYCNVCRNQKQDLRKSSRRRS